MPTTAFDSSSRSEDEVKATATALGQVVDPSLSQSREKHGVSEPWPTVAQLKAALEAQEVEVGEHSVRELLP